MDSFAQTNLVTPAQYLASQPKPNFAPGNHLPPLTRWGGGFYTNDMVELANDWGYALEFNMYVTPNEVTNDMLIPGTMDNLWLLMVNNNPSKYKLAVMIDRTFPYPTPSGFWCTNSKGEFVDSYSNTWTSITYTNGTYVCTTNPNAGFPLYNLVCSPEGPDSYWTNATAYWINSLKAVQSNAPIAIILNGGEYGLNTLGWAYGAFTQDPRVQAQAVMTNPFTSPTNVYVIVNTNGTSWSRYISNRKAHQLGLLTSAIRQNFPNRQLYIFYHTDAELGRSYNLNSLANEYWEDMFDWWSWNSDVMNTNTDLPSFQFYYSNVGQWTNVPNDFLTQYLDQVGYDINLGYKTNYCWVDAGDATDGNQYNTNNYIFSDIPRYIGFLKCLYMGGMNGAVACNFSVAPTNPPGWEGAFPSNSPPNWLQQLIALSRVHGLFSQLETFIDNSDLISGPQSHAVAQDQPAYEFTNTVGDIEDRVLARKIRGTNEWLICAWAADGKDTNVTVTIPTLGSVTVLARNSGAVYLASTTNMFAYLASTTNLLPEEMSFPNSPQPPPGGP